VVRGSKNILGFFFTMNKNIYYNDTLGKKWTKIK
jgi:hypothetical protein